MQQTDSAVASGAPRHPKVPNTTGRAKIEFIDFSRVLMPADQPWWPHRPGDHYVERFYTPIVGPTSVLLLRYLDELLTEAEDRPVVLPARDVHPAVGLGAGGGGHGRLISTLDRLRKFGICNSGVVLANTYCIEIPDRLRPLSPKRVGQLTPSLATQHAQFIARTARREAS